MKTRDILSIVACAAGLIIFNELMAEILSAGASYALITAGFTKSCAARSGGVKNIWIANRTELDTAGFTLSGDDYSAVTMVTDKVFYKYEFDQDTAEHRHSASLENNSAQVNNEIEFYLGKLSTTMRGRLQEILDVSSCGMVAIVEDNNSVKWVYGYTENHPTNSATQGRPLKASTIDGASGKVFTDQTGANVVLASLNNEMPRVFTGSVPV